jgi:dUTP pyrophosphatase
MKVKIKKLHKDARMPVYAYDDDACADLYAYIRSGFAMEIPIGYSVQIYPRSGKACKSQLIELNSPGIIDSSYRGELLTCMKNLSNDIVSIKKGDRYAQMFLVKNIKMYFEEVDELNETDRGDGGFGSSGK